MSKLLLKDAIKHLENVCKHKHNIPETSIQSELEHVLILLKQYEDESLEPVVAHELLNVLGKLLDKLPAIKALIDMFID